MSMPKGAARNILGEPGDAAGRKSWGAASGQGTSAGTPTLQGAQATSDWMGGVGLYAARMKCPPPLCNRAGRAQLGRHRAPRLWAPSQAVTEWGKPKSVPADCSPRFHAAKSKRGQGRIRARKTPGKSGHAARTCSGRPPPDQRQDAARAATILCGSAARRRMPHRPAWNGSLNRRSGS